MNQYDATIYVSIAEVLTSNHPNIGDIFKKLSSVLDVDLQYTTLPNILSLIILYTSPVVYTSREVYLLVKLLIELQEPQYDLEEYSNWLSDQLDHVPIESLLRTANDLFIASDSTVHFDITDVDDLLFQFVKQKIVADSKYYNGENFKLTYKLLSHYEPFLLWFNGIVEPYLYYYKYFGQVTFQEFLNEDFDKFGLFVSVDNIGTTWMQNVILPYLKYSQESTKLIKWISNEKFVGKYKLWNIVIKEFSPNVDVLLVKEFLYEVYFDSIYSGMSTVETMEVYDIVIDTLNYLDVKNKHDAITDFSNFKIDSQNKDNFKSSFNELFSEPATLLQIVQACQKLHPYNQLSIARYIQLKQKKDLLELNKILNNLTKINYRKVLDLANYFVELFMKGDEATAQSVILRLLLDVSVYDTEVFTAYPLDDLITSKIWNLLETSTKLHDSNLEQVKECINLLSEDSVATKFQSLLKAIDGMKGYRISINHKSILPSDLTKSDVEPITILLKILELNPKAYVNYDRLNVVLSELTSFHDIPFKASSSELKCLCIESALKLGNFEYAHRKSIELIKQKKTQCWKTVLHTGSWSGGKENKKILTQQRELLSLVLGFPEVNNVQILKQWKSINSLLTEIVNRENELFLEVDNEIIETDVNNVRMSARGSNNFNNLNMSGAAAASDTITNLLTSGLGWAIGANQS